MGVAYREKGMTDAAITEYERAVAIDPDVSGKVYNNLAVLYYFEKEYDLAIQYCERADELGYKVHPKVLEDLKAYR